MSFCNKSVWKLVWKFPIMISFPFIFQASIGSATDKGYIVSILLLRLTLILFSSSVLFLLCFVRQSWIWLWFDLFECFVQNNQLWFVHIWNWAFMWKGNFLSCFKVLLSFCQVVPSSQPPSLLCFRKSVHNQIILPTNSILPLSTLLI